MKLKTKLHKWQLKFDRVFSEGVWQQVLILLGVFVLAQIIGWIVCSQLTFGENAQKLTFWEWAFYIFIDGNALNTIYMDDFPDGGGRWVMLFCTLGSVLGVIVFGGMLISVFTNMLGRRIENYRSGRNTYVISGHTIILGYDEIVPSIIKKICDSNKDMYILLQSSLPSEALHEKIRVSIAQEYEERIIIKNGHRTSKQDLNELRLNKSSEVFVVGDRSNENHDAMNIECLEIVAELIKLLGNCSLHTITAVFEDANTYSAMVLTDLFKDIRDLGIEFVPFNFYVDWAKQMFVDCRYTDYHKDEAGNYVIHKYRPLDGDGISPSDHRHVHLVIIGTSTFGVTLAVEAAKMLHFPNFDGRNNRTEITFIDRNGDTEMYSFVSRYRHFFEVQSYRYGNELIPATKFRGQDADFLDVEFSFIKGDIYTPEIQSLLVGWAEDSQQLLSVVIPTCDSRQNLSIAMSFPDELFKCQIPIFIRQDSSGRFINKLQNSRYSNIYPFGMTDIAFDVQRPTRTIAECINYIYKLNQELPDLPSLKNAIMTAPHEDIYELWSQCEVSKQWSSLYAAYSIPFRIRSMKASGLSEKDSKTMSLDMLKQYGFTEHNRWNVEKLLMGFRKPEPAEDAYSLSASPEEKQLFKTEKQKEFIHCHIRPYDQLETSTQANDTTIIWFTSWLNEIIKNE